MYASCNNNCNSNNCCRSGFFANYQPFWIIVVVAIVIIWVHYGAGAWGGCGGGWGGCNNNCNCGCENDCNPCC